MSKNCKNCEQPWGLHNADTLQCPCYEDATTWRTTIFQDYPAVSPALSAPNVEAILPWPGAGPLIEAINSLSVRCGFPIVENYIQVLETIGNKVERLESEASTQPPALSEGVTEADFEKAFADWEAGTILPTNSRKAFSAGWAAALRGPASLPVVEYPYNPAHKIGTCGKCGGEMAYNVPRLGPDGGFIRADGRFLCDAAGSALPVRSRRYGQRRRQQPVMLRAERPALPEDVSTREAT